MAAAQILMIVSSSSYSSPPNNQRAMVMDPTTQTLSGSFSAKAKMRTTSLLLARASNPKSEEQQEDFNSKSAFSSPEDLNYLWKLGVGSVGGAAVIKFGSILFPEITRPNIIEALIMITTPVILAILLLIKESRAGGQRKGPF